MTKPPSTGLQKKRREAQLQKRARNKAISDLNRDKRFLVANERIWRRLDTALRNTITRSDVIRFFQVFPAGCDVSSVSLIREFLGTVREKHLRELLWDYVKFCLRYRVDFALAEVRSKRKLRFEIVYPEPQSDSFRARLVHGRFEAISESRGRGVRIPKYELPIEAIPEYCRQHVAHGEARYIRIDDRWLESPLTDIERLTYDPTKVVFVEHRAEIPYLHILGGAKASKRLLRNAQTAITQFQRTLMQNTLAGPKLSPKSVKAMKGAFVATRKGNIPGKKLALDLLPDHSFQSAQNFVSKTRKLLKE